MRKLLLTSFVIVFCGSVFCQTQTTVTFKPNSTIGKDAVLWTTGMCGVNGNPIPCADINYGNWSELLMQEWTWMALGCDEGTRRSLIKFEQLSTIPANAQIVSAELKLFGVSTSYDYGNSSYPGAPPGLYPNQSFIQRVTSTWDEQTVTWNTQPTTTTVNQIAIPPSTSQWDWNFSNNSANLVAMVQDMVTNPETNFGFMLRLETEVYYRSLMFASSDHSNPALWPELTVTYTTSSPPPPPPCPCEANFSYLTNTVDLNSYYFTASNFAVNHRWIVDGVAVSTASSFVYNFTAGSHQICYVRELEDRKCEKNIILCIDNIPQNDENGEDVDPTTVPQGIMFPGDIISFDNNNKIEVYPNPTTNDWTVKIIAEKEETVKIQLTDLNGRIVYSDNKALTVGNNSFVVRVNDLTQGSYILQIIGNTIRFSNVLLKE
jgi:hypothetical protein